MIFEQIFDSINIGIVILDRDLKVYGWNRWMEVHSGINKEKIKGKQIFDVFPNLNTPKFIRGCKSVFTLGSFCAFSPRLHHYLFPFKKTGYSNQRFEYMQQSCRMGPIRDENNEIKYLFIYVEDVTELACREQIIHEMNLRDGLTGVFNRKFMGERLKKEFSRYKRYGGVFSIIMFDIDYFKKVNDTYGHLCGDFILKSVSSKVVSLIRDIDCMFRYGGEEFCCLLPETEIDPARVVAERLREEIALQENIFEGNTIKVTMSLGVAVVEELDDSYERLLQRADEALYKAKAEGRNRVVVSG
ncbi:MAG: diguanylate cyclase [Nitrospirae bacterium]|nr:diguanylate cyclase [Nitrospirota bacterium]